MDRKEAIKNYKNTPTPVGVFRIRNNRDGKSFIGSSVNLPAMLNRQRFQLDHGAHANKQLQADWSTMGAGSFTIESLDVLEPPKEGTWDPSDDLNALEAMWREKIAVSDALY